MHPSIEKILKLPNKQKITILVSTLVLIAAVFYFLLIKPKQEELTGFQTKLSDLQTQIQENRKIADNLPRLQKEYYQLSKELENALTELPDQKQIPLLLTSITNAGKVSGLDFLVFKPRPEEPKEFYASVPVDITVSGTYLSVSKFFVAVSELPRIVNITNVAFTDIKSSGDQTNLKVTCLATTFRFLNKKEIKDDKKEKK
jgi:type IV pilus assembly protein PilO